MEFGIIICGGGATGMACGITAAEQGAHPVVIEKNAELGGSIAYSSGRLSAAGSRLQRAQGIEDSPDIHFEEVMRVGHGKNDPVLVRLAVDEAAHTIDWLEELGLPFSEEMPVIYYRHEPYERPRSCWGPDLGASVLNAVKPRFEELVAAGRIELLVEHRLVELLVERGAVVGARAEGPMGETELRGRSIVLATGGYAGSREFFDKLHPSIRYLLAARVTSTGDGIVAAQSIGAGFRGTENHIPAFGGIETHPGSGRCEYKQAFANLVSEYRPPREIYVSERGKRFIREDSPSPDASERALVAEGGRMWIVFDESAIEDGEPLVTGWSTAQLRERAVSGENVWVADTLSGLARSAGIDPDALVRTVDEYNASVRSGSDPLGRESLANEVATPPYYAVLTEASTAISFGGVTVDGELRVTNSSGEPIPGLYAAGEVLGASATMGDAFCSGMMLTPALSLGRILGRRLAVANRVAPAVAS